MKKFLCSIMLFFLLCSPAGAFVPLAIPAWYWGASVALHVAAAVAGIYYSMTPSTPASVQPDCSVNRSSKVTWVDLTLPTPAVVEKSITAKMDNGTLRSIAGSKDAAGTRKYPNLYSALNGNSVPGPTPSSGVGVTLQTPAGPRVSTDAYNTYVNYYEASPGTVAFIGTYPSRVIALCYFGAVPGNSNQSTSVHQVVFDNPVVVPPVKPYSNPFGSHLLTGTGASEVPLLSAQNMAANYQAEIDAAFQDSAYTPTFTDDTTGLPYAPPPGSSVASPASVTAYNTSQQAIAASAAAVSSANTASITAAATAANASSVAAAAAAAAAASPGDAGLAAAAATAAAAAGAANNAAALAAASAATAASNDAAAAAAAAADNAPITTGNPSAGSNTYDSVITPPDKKDLLGKISGWMSNSPLAVLAKSLSISGSSEVSSYSFLFRGKTIVVDFSRWDNYFSTAGASLLLISHALALFIVLRKD